MAVFNCLLFVTAFENTFIWALFIFYVLSGCERRQTFVALYSFVVSALHSVIFFYIFCDAGIVVTVFNSCPFNFLFY